MLTYISYSIGTGEFYLAIGLAWGAAKGLAKGLAMGIAMGLARTLTRPRLHKLKPKRPPITKTICRFSFQQYRAIIFFLKTETI